MKYRDLYENVNQLVAGYFHQDWKLDTDEPEQVVAQFIADTPPKVRADTVKESRQILAKYDGRELDTVMLELDCYYSPERYRGVSMRQWLQEVIAEFEKSLKS